MPLGTARTIVARCGFCDSALDLDPRSGPWQALAAGMILGNITAGDKTWTERLVIQK